MDISATEHESIIGTVPDQTIPEGKGLFLLSLEICRDLELSDLSARYLEQSIPSDSDFFLINGVNLRYPQKNRHVPVDTVTEIIKNDLRGIFCRTVHEDRVLKDADRVLFAVFLGSDPAGNAVIAGVVCSGKCPRENRQEDHAYNFLARLRRFYGEFAASRTIGQLLAENCRYRYVLDRRSGEIMLTLPPTPAEPAVQENDCNHRTADCLARKILRLQPEDLHIGTLDSHLENVSISHVSVSKTDYTLLSFVLRQSRPDGGRSSNSVINSFSDKVSGRLGALQTAAGQLALKKGKAVDERDLNLLQTIEQAATSITLMVNRLSQYYTADTGTSAPFDLNTVIAENIARARDMYANPLAITFAPGADSAVIKGDVRQISRAIHELLDNALVACDKKGEVHLSLSRVAGAIELVIENDITHPQNPAVPGEVLLEPFTSTMPGHAGMGLPISQKIISDHGGTIEIDTGLKSRFRVRVAFPESRPGRIL
ncbi:MAG: HAMP domain-containing histidine kinase [Candidatus Zixiibacteriota bacterium]|nr:MAG: HAMP domain-containing histidine kinase [candidate division Zixibacteria bacterium]